jgi:hypothetical protein
MGRRGALGLRGCSRFERALVDPRRDGPWPRRARFPVQKRRVIDAAPRIWSRPLRLVSDPRMQRGEVCDADAIASFGFGFIERLVGAGNRALGAFAWVSNGEPC